MKALAFDFGGSSGRAVLGWLEDGRLLLKEIYRFQNDPIQHEDQLCWDIIYLFAQLREGIRQAVAVGGFDSIGIDTWGQDFGLISEMGELVSLPVFYRDQYTAGIPEQVFEILSKEEIYQRTGIQFTRLNTLYQLYATLKKYPERIHQAKKFLLMPDLFNWYLTGDFRSERTEASTTQMLDVHTGLWCLDFARRLGIPEHIFPDITIPGKQYGRLKTELAKEFGCPQIDVISVASHDTASAVTVLPTLEDHFLYISSGTWSLFGTELQQPVINHKTLTYNLTNESGYPDKIRLLKNIMGLWLIQESRREWQRQGKEYSFADLERLALTAAPFTCFIDPDAPDFELPGDLPNRVQEYCRRTGQYIPQTDGEIMRCIYESLSLKYRLTAEMIEDVTCRHYPVIYIVGGGVKDRLLCAMTADACNKTVVTGLPEATAAGNIAVQLVAGGKLKTLKDIRRLILHSYATTSYEPHYTQAWDKAYGDFLKVLNR